MSRTFEELDYRQTPIGDLSLRRRRELSLDVDVFEIKLGDEFLMSSLFTASEVALADLALADLSGTGPPGSDPAPSRRPAAALDVCVGGLGLGHTAHAVLAHTAVRSLVVVEMLDAVVDWHEQGLVPLGEALTGDPRCRFVRADFFASCASADGLDPARSGRKFDAILVDIDHTPDALLDTRSTGFYRPEGLRALAAHLRPGGTFGLWSNAAPDPAFTARLASVFAEARAEPVTFFNPLQHRPVTQTVYLASTGRAASRGSAAG